MSKEPVVKFKSSIAGGLQLAGWQNERGISWNLSKRYKDKETGGWKETKNLNDWDLDAIASLVAQAKEFNAERRKAAKGGAVTEEAPPPTFLVKKYDVADDEIPF